MNWPTNPRSDRETEKHRGCSRGSSISRINSSFLTKLGRAAREVSYLGRQGAYGRRLQLMEEEGEATSLLLRLPSWLLDNVRARTLGSYQSSVDFINVSKSIQDKSYLSKLYLILSSWLQIGVLPFSIGWNIPTKKVFLGKIWEYLMQYFLHHKNNLQQSMILAIVTICLKFSIKVSIEK
jgi:hypothetical protein